MYLPVTQFLHDERGAVTVDWTVLSAAAVGMALATVGVLEFGIGALSGRIDNELRTQTLSDDFVTYLSGHFEPIIAAGGMTNDDGEYVFNALNELMNHEIIEALDIGIDLMEAGELSDEEIAILVGMGSVADQRNIVSDVVLDHYFGFDGGDPVYMDYYGGGAPGGSFMNDNNQVATN